MPTPRSRDTAAWTAVDDGWRLGLGPLSAVVSHAGPAGGLLDARHGSTPLGMTLCRVDTGAALAGPAEVYARGADLIATHPPSDDWPFRTQLQWSGIALADADATLLTLAVSLQTDLLDTRPAVDLVSAGDRPCGVRREPSGGAFLAWVADDATPPLAAAAHPDDRAESALLAAAGVGRLRFAPPFLEKGVIRRCLAGVVIAGPAADPDDALAAGLEALAHSAAPLTA